VDHAVAFPEDSLAHAYLSLSGGLRVGPLLDHPVQAECSKAPARHGGKDLDFAVLSVVAGDPFPVELIDHIHGRQPVMKARPGVDGFQHGQKLIRAGAGFQYIIDADMGELFGNMDTGFIRSGFIRPERIRIAVFIRAHLTVGHMGLNRAPKFCDKLDLIHRCLFRVDKEAVVFLPPDSWFPEGGVDPGGLPAIDLMGMPDNERFSGLPENGCQPDAGNSLRSDDVIKDIAGAHRWKLVRVADEQHLAGVGHCTQKGCGKADVEHGAFVHHQEIGAKR